MAQGKGDDREMAMVIQERGVHAKSLRLGSINEDTSPMRIQNNTMK